MKSQSLDLLYVDLDRHIRLVESYTEVEGLAFVLRAARLKPHTFLFEKREDNLVLYYKWCDEFGNLLRINNDKSIDILNGDLSLSKGKIICTDLYAGLTLDKIAKISKLVHVCFGTTELLDNFVFLTFLGLDNYLRCFFYHEEWQMVSPLMLGINNLLFIAKHRDAQYYTHRENKDCAPIPCFEAQDWVSNLPPETTFLSSLNKRCEVVVNILTGVFNGK